MQLISNSSQKQQRLHLDLEMAPRLFFGIQHGWMASSAYWSMKLRHVSWFCQIFTIGVERSLNIISCAYIEVYMLKTNPKDNKLCQLLRHVGLLECLCTAPMNCPAVHVVSFCSFGLLKKMAGAVFWLNQWYTCLHIVNTANGFSLQWGHGPREWGTVPWPYRLRPFGGAQWEKRQGLPVKAIRLLAILVGMGALEGTRCYDFSTLFHSVKPNCKIEEART